MSKIWGIPSPTNRGPKTTFFGRLRNLTATLTAYMFIFGKRRDIYISGQVRCKLQGVSYIVSKRHKLWPTNDLKLDRRFHQPYENSTLHFIARLRRRRSANRTQPNFVTRVDGRIMKAQTACFFTLENAQNSRMKAHRHVTKAHIFMENKSNQNLKTK